jgi:mono/diheme cytochrome c family protein
MKMKTLVFTLVSSLSIALTIATAAEKKEKKEVDSSKLPPAADKKDVTYDKDIKPIFEKSCFGCHGADKQKSKLRLDSAAAAIKGGENGPDIVKGKSAESTLVHAVAGLLDEDENMPPSEKRDKYPALTKEQIGLVRAWIDQGAK